MEGLRSATFSLSILLSFLLSFSLVVSWIVGDDFPCCRFLRQGADSPRCPFPNLQMFFSESANVPSCNCKMFLLEENDAKK